jgi:hypothetical protein
MKSFHGELSSSKRSLTGSAHGRQEPRFDEPSAPELSAQQNCSNLAEVSDGTTRAAAPLGNRELYTREAVPKI